MNVRRCPRGLWSALSLLVLLVPAGCGTAPPAAVAHVVELRGDVQVNGKPAAPKMSLFEGDTLIASGEQSWASVEFQDHTLVRLAAITGAGLQSKLVISSWEKGTGSMLLRLLGGVVSLVSSSQARGAGRRLETLTSVTACEGTQVAVRSEESGDTVSLKQGRVRVTELKTGESVSLRDNQRVHVMPGQAPGQPTPYDWTVDGQRELFEAAAALGERNF